MRAKSFRFSDDVVMALESLSSRYNMSQTQVLNLLILDRASISDTLANVRRKHIRRDEILAEFKDPTQIFNKAYNSGWLDFQTRHGKEEMIEPI